MDLLIVALIASTLWIASFAFYLYTSKQHDRIENEIERVRQVLSEREM